MKRLLSATCATLLCSQTFATPVYHPPGPNLTYGSVSNSQTIMSEITNPAAGAASLDKNGGGVRFGILSNIGAGYEVGDVDDMYDRLDNVITDFENAFANVIDPTDASLIDAQIDNANNLLIEIEDGGYGKVFTSFHVPIMPIVLSSNALGGNWVFDASVTAVAKVSAIGDQLSFDSAGAQAFINAAAPDSTFNAGDVTLNFNNVGALSYALNDNDSSLVGRSAGIIEAAVGYSTQITKMVGGKVFAGVRGKYYQVTLLQDADKFVSTSTADDTEDFLDELRDLDNGVESTGFGVDFGLLWVSDHLRLGAMLTNINEPEFDYNEFDTTGFTDPDIIARMNELSGATYTMEAQATVEVAIHSKNQRWVLSGALDLNEIGDPVGDEYQWATVSAAYATNNWWLPGLRAGYRVNQAGTELTYLTGGITVFNALNLDVAYSPDKVTDDSGDEVSRSIIFNMGLELTF